jgi:hypothetical protein
MARTLTTLALVLAALGSTSARGQTPPAPKPDKKGNASLIYWQAFAVLPQLNPDRSKILDDWETVELAGPALPLLEDAKKSLALLHRGAHLANCDWGLSKDDGPDLLLPHLSKARELAKYALLRARSLLATGKQTAAVDDLVDVLALAHHIGVDSVLIGLVVQDAIETQGLEALARILPDLNAGACRHLANRLRSLPREGTFQDALRAEKDIILAGSIQQLQQAQVVPNKGLEAVLRAAGGPKGPVTLMEEVGAYYDEVAKLPPLPRDEFRKRLAELNKKLESNPFGKLLLPALQKVLAAEDRTQAKRALFQAALAVVQGGPEALKTIRDPFGDGPFEYRALKHGFELKSQLAHGPVATLVVGRGPR